MPVFYGFNANIDFQVFGFRFHDSGKTGRCILSAAQAEGFLLIFDPLAAETETLETKKLKLPRSVLNIRCE